MNYKFDMEIKPGENIFAALGFDKEEAEQLAAESRRRIAAHDAIKRNLAEALIKWIKESNLTQQEAAERFAVSRPRVSDLVRQQLNNFSIDSLIRMALRTGKNVELTLK